MNRIFISHASADDAFVADLRQRLEALGCAVWVDSRRLAERDRLTPEIEAAITEASQVLVVLSASTVNSPSVAREVRRALEVQRERQDDYRVVALLRPGITEAAVGVWFPEEPVAVVVGEDGLAAAMPLVLAALGEALPTDEEPMTTPPVGAVDELILRLSEPHIATENGVRRAQALAQVVYEPARPGQPAVEGRRFRFTAPLGLIEADDLRWYLERYHLWPAGVFRDRAAAIEIRLPAWGQALSEAVRGDARVFTAWERASGEVTERRFSVLVDDDPPLDSTPEAEAAASEAATELLALPWELLHDGTAWLFQGRSPVRVRRRLPNRALHDERQATPPVRILLVSPRPERTPAGDPVGYLDHRAGARPLADAVETLGELARLTVLEPPTFAALERALGDGFDGQPFDVVHFDGHGVYDRRLGLGGLCFEQPEPQPTRSERTLDFVDSVRLAELVRSHRIPLMFLDTCQTAVAETDPTASIAARMLDEGVASVVAMSHSVLAETGRRFVHQFYAELARGARVGTAMLAGQRALFDDPHRGKVIGAGELRLQDWFVPVLYQQRLDPQPIGRLPGRAVQRLAEQTRILSLGELPPSPEHHFQGRSRELLALERHLYHAQWAVVRGTGGQGKTTLVVELARWLVRTHRAQRAVFVSLDHQRDPHAVLDAIGRQLLPDFSVVGRPLDEARLPVERALVDQPVILVVDNCESVLPDSALDDTGDGEDTSAEIFALCRRLLDAGPRTRLVFTTREPLPHPFARGDHDYELGALHRDDAIELVGQVMAQHGWVPPADDDVSSPDQLTELVMAVHSHPRALVLLAREVADRGVMATITDLRALMADLDRAHPGEQENSLYASVAFSLRRLSPETRRQVHNLACCQGGAHLAVIEAVSGLDMNAVRNMCRELIGVGLAEDLGVGHLRLDPGLAPYLLGELFPADVEALCTRWAEAMIQLVSAIHREQFGDAQLAGELTVLELPNLRALLDWLPDHQPPEQVVGIATTVEALLQHLGQPRALAHAVRIRERAAAQLTGWSRAHHHAASAQIDRLLERGDLPAALTGAQRLLDQHRATGPDAYPKAEYDTAMTLWQLGQVLRTGGAAESALTSLEEARHLFQELADTGDNSAASMAPVALGEIGDCLLMLGRLDAAADAYQEAIERATWLGHSRAAAVAAAQLATVRLEQGRYQEAADGYAQARVTFEALGEPRSVATTWHQTGLAHEQTGRFDAAEDAYRHALAIKVREADLRGQARTLGQLGTLYQKLGRPEDAVAFLVQAAEIYIGSADRAAEGRTRRNLARTLLDMRRYDEARRELQRALECNEDFGHAAQPWTTWALMEDLEHATGHPDAARTARDRAVTSYLAYRHDGGTSHSNRISLFISVAQAIDENQPGELARELADLLEPDSPPWVTAVIRCLQAILNGERNPGLAERSDIDPVDAAELLLLLESLDHSSEVVQVPHDRGSHTASMSSHVDDGYRSGLTPRG